MASTPSLAAACLGFWTPADVAARISKADTRLEQPTSEDLMGLDAAALRRMIDYCGKRALMIAKEDEASFAQYGTTLARLRWLNEISERCGTLLTNQVRCEQGDLNTSSHVP